MIRWLMPLAVTLVIEVPLVASLFPGQRLKMATVATLANVATNLTLNLLVTQATTLGRYQVPGGEIFAAVIEATAYGLASRPHDWVASTLAASLANALSFGVGFTGALGALR